MKLFARWRRPAPGEVRGAGYALAVVLVLAGIGVHVLGGGASSTGSAPMETAGNAPLRDLTVLDAPQTRRLRSLRDEAIDCMGWAAGNSFREPIWPEVESFVGHRGIYYDDFIRLVPPGLPEELGEAESAANYERYSHAFARGRQAEHDPVEARRCVERAIEISDVLERMLEAVRAPRSLDSPVSVD